MFDHRFLEEGGLDWFDDALLFGEAGPDVTSDGIGFEEDGSVVNSIPKCWNPKINDLTHSSIPGPTKVSCMIRASARSLTLQKK